jgi:hypothetical protein
MIGTVFFHTLSVQQCKHDKDKARLSMKKDLNVDDVVTVSIIQITIFSMRTEHQACMTDDHTTLEILRTIGGNTLEIPTIPIKAQMNIRPNYLLDSRVTNFLMG